MTVETRENHKTHCTACPRCGESLDKQQSLAKHIRWGDCEPEGE